MSALLIIVRICNILSETIKKKEIKNKKPMHGWSFDVAHGLKRLMNES